MTDVAKVATLALHTMLIVACCHSKCCLLSVLERWRLAAPFYVIVCLSFTLRVSTYVHGSSFMVKCGNNWKSTHPLIGNHARCSTLMGTLSWDYDTQLWAGKSYNSYVCVSIQSHADVKVTLEGTKPIGWGPKQLQPCICVNDKGTTVIGASLSEPNTSGTALHKCVCICACLWPYIVNFKRAFKYFSKILRPWTVKDNAGLLPECSIGFPEWRRLKLKHARQLTSC